MLDGQTMCIMFVTKRAVQPEIYSLNCITGTFSRIGMLFKLNKNFEDGGNFDRLVSNLHKSPIQGAFELRRTKKTFSVTSLIWTKKNTHKHVTFNVENTVLSLLIVRL